MVAQWKYSLLFLARLNEPRLEAKSDVAYPPNSDFNRQVRREVSSSKVPLNSRVIRRALRRSSTNSGSQAWYNKPESIFCFSVIVEAILNAEIWPGGISYSLFLGIPARHIDSFVSTWVVWIWSHEYNTSDMETNIWWKVMKVRRAKASWRKGRYSLLLALSSLAKSYLMETPSHIAVLTDPHGWWDVDDEARSITPPRIIRRLAGVMRRNYAVTTVTQDCIPSIFWSHTFSMVDQILFRRLYHHISAIPWNPPIFL